MAPIHDTDLAETRWTQSEWEHYELWERIELRLRRRRRIWVVGAVLLFVVISAIPIVRDHWPKWAALSQVRSMGQEINAMKRMALVDRVPYRIRVDGKSDWVVERLNKCTDSTGSQVHSGSIGSELFWIDPNAAKDLNIPGLTLSFCFDPFNGSESAASGASVVGLGVIPKSDISESRSDRLAVVLLTGPSGEVSFE